MKNKQTNILLVDCGSRFINKLEESFRRYAFVKRIKIDDLEQKDFKSIQGIVISGSPTLITETNPISDITKTKLCVGSKLPLLGVCYGHQLIGINYGANISLGELRKGEEKIIVLEESPLLRNINKKELLLQEAHREEITLPKEFKLIGTSQRTEVEIMQHQKKTIFGVEFHPEISGDVGQTIISNFVNIVNNHNN